MAETPEKQSVLGKLTPAAAGIGAAAGTFLGLRSLNEVPPWVVRLIETRGLDYVIALIVIILGAYFLQLAVTAVTKQAVGTEKMALAMERIANEGGELRHSMTEVSLNQGVIASRTGRMEERLDGISGQLERLLKKAGEGLGEKLDRLSEKLEGEKVGG